MLRPGRGFVRSEKDRVGRRWPLQATIQTYLNHIRRPNKYHQQGDMIDEHKAQLMALRAKKLEIEELRARKMEIEIEKTEGKLIEYEVVEQAFSEIGALAHDLTVSAAVKAGEEAGLDRAAIGRMKERIREGINAEAEARKSHRAG